MNKQSLINFCFIFILIHPLMELGAQELKPHNVIIQSSYQKQNKLAPFNQHSIRLFIPKESFEPYLPELLVPQYNPPLSYAHNINLSGLTRSFGTLSELFTGEQGILENALVLYNKKQYQLAAQKLIGMLPLDSLVGEKATLLLAWVKFSDNRWQDAMLYAKAGFQSDNLSIVIESTYLYSLILYNLEEYEQLAVTIQQQIKTHHLDFWDTRIPVLYLAALSKLSRWSSAFQFQQQIKLERLSHHKAVYHLFDLAGTISYQLKQYKQAQIYFEKARSLNPDLDYRKQLNRKILWSVYQQENYKEVLELLDTFRKSHLLVDSEEILYLKFACQAHLLNWTDAKESFSRISNQSDFFIPAAFLFQTLFKSNIPDPVVDSRLKGITYDFPEMLFHAALHKGINAFKAGQYKKAESFFKNASTADFKSNDLHLAQFNLGLSYLKQSDFQASVSTFESLQQSVPHQLLPFVYYHLLFSYYQRSQTDLFIAKLQESGLKFLPTETRWEILFMKANILLANNQYSEAAALFGSIWEMQNKISALEKSVIALYQAKQYKRVLGITQKHKTPSNTLFIYRIKSLLGLNQFQQALEEVDHLRSENDEIVKLQIEVWLANQKHQRIVTKVRSQLKKKGSSDVRLHYYLSLGDALFNLNRHVESKNQFYKALALTDDPLRKSLIQYNISLIAFHSKDYPSFLKETKVILASEDLVPEMRYNLTQLLVNHHQAQGEHKKVDQILKDYVQEYSFLKTKAILKRLQLLNQNGMYKKCASLASKAIENEDLYQRRDRLILNGYCANQTGETKAIQGKLETELSKKSIQYRQKELQYVLANTYFNDRKFRKSLAVLKSIQRNKMEREARIKTTLLLVDSLIHLRKSQEAGAELGEASQYRKTSFYSKALALSAEISLLENKVDDSLRSLLRIHYMKNLPDEEKLSATLRIIEILIDHKREQEAQKYYAAIVQKNLQGHPGLVKRFQSASAKLAKK